MSYTQSLNLVIVLNGIGFPMRILPGYLADTYLGPLNTFLGCTLIANVILFGWLGVTSIPTYYVFITLYGLFAAAFQSLFSTAVVALSSDLTKTGTRLGMATTVLGFSALVGGPLSGALLKASGGDYKPVIAWAGVSCAVGWVLCAAGRIAKFGWGVKTKC